jgi:hypothetical protein
LTEQPAFKLTPRQNELNKLLAGPATHVLAYGGARSGKTFTMVRAIDQGHARRR